MGYEPIESFTLDLELTMKYADSYHSLTTDFHAIKHHYFKKLTKNIKKPDRNIKVDYKKDAVWLQYFGQRERAYWDATDRAKTDTHKNLIIEEKEKRIKDLEKQLLAKNHGE